MNFSVENLRIRKITIGQFITFCLFNIDNLYVLKVSYVLATCQSFFFGYKLMYHIE